MADEVESIEILIANKLTVSEESIVRMSSASKVRS
jgi:hypothetical protein